MAKKKIPVHLQKWINEVKSVKEKAKKKGITISHSEALKIASDLRKKKGKKGGSIWGDIGNVAVHALPFLL